MAATIRDVALKAGVSISTVSRVLNDTCPVAGDKRERVERAARELGYTPNPAARSLLSHETGGIGIILPFVSGEFFSEFLYGVDQAAQEQDFFLLISTSHHSSGDLKKAMAGMYRRVDGLLVMAPHMTTQVVEALSPQGMPFVFVNTEVVSNDAYGVTFDNYGGMYAMTTHLLSQGHRRIAFVTGTENAYDSRERLRGHLQALKDAGITPSDDLIFNGNYDQKAGFDAGNRVLRLDDRPTAIMASNDDSAIGVLSALRQAGLSIPGDVAVTGFDDVPSAQYATPPLSSVHVPVRQLGMAAVDLLVARLHDPHREPQMRMLPVELRIRESSK
ncbi:MAG: LacI family DNA-binding transcriptional regulator [Bacteroidetes bacterium]|nr:LacI family DNA-binding transcriptional regulator [Bacteroidota bacterium]MDA1333500.1 LacI family DNA-binding transcriptional regulator [Bacteroidota bacterium]